MATEFKLPELGENIERGNVVRVMVSVGDTIEADQPVLEIETDKASLEVPSSVAGRVAEVRAQEGKPLSVGDVVLIVESGADGAAKEKPADDAKAAPKPEAKKEKAKAEAAPPKPEAKQEPEETTEAPSGAEDEEKAGAAESAESDDDAEQARPEEAPQAAARPSSTQGVGPVPASPSVRRLAREIGVDVHQVAGTGQGGRITEEDVKVYARQLNTDAARSAPVAPAAGLSGDAQPLPDFSRWGQIERSELTGVRRRTAENMRHAWQTVPQVTQFDKADCTDVDRLRKQYAKQVEAAGGKLTMTAILLKVLPAALRKFPQFNASLDAANNELVYKNYCHIGVAVDTDRGLLVPVIRDCDKKSIVEISAELTDLAERARNRKVTLDEMQGGSFTISNLGGIGGTGFTPIVNWSEVAILGVARSQTEPVWRDGQFVPRTMLPLSLSYDHRVVDGADGARFLRWVCQAIEQPFLLMLEGV